MLFRLFQYYFFGAIELSLPEFFTDREHRSELTLVLGPQNLMLIMWLVISRPQTVVVKCGTESWLTCPSVEVRAQSETGLNFYNQVKPDRKSGVCPSLRVGCEWFCQALISIDCNVLALWEITFFPLETWYLNGELPLAWTALGEARHQMITQV